jgi:hypothetical protein
VKFENVKSPWVQLPANCKAAKLLTPQTAAEALTAPKAKNAKGAQNLVNIEIFIDIPFPSPL